jgi:hypothetical protein
LIGSISASPTIWTACWRQWGSASRLNHSRNENKILVGPRITV